MSFIIDHIHQVDSQLDQLQLPEVNAASDAADNWEWTRVAKLRVAIKSLSAASASRVLLHPMTIKDVLQLTQFIQSTTSVEIQDESETSAQVKELEWLLVSKATAQTYGLILNVLLEQIIPLSTDIWYWEEVLGSYTNTALYTVQSSPQMFWRWGKEIYYDASQRLQSIQSATEEHSQPSLSISDRWAQFYGLVKDTVRERSLANVQSKIISPLTVCRSEVRKKQRHLKRLREMSASGLGLLIDEAMVFDTNDEGSVYSRNASEDKEEWRSALSKSVALMETVLRNVTLLELGSTEFEDTVFTSFLDDPENFQHGEAEQEPLSESAKLASRLQQLLGNHLPTHVAAAKRIVEEHGRPPRIVRYWVPVLLVFVSSSTLLRIFFNRQAEIMTWIQDIGITTRDFWYNWVVEPLRRVIGTIRHDEDGEIALMSKESLEGDRASLERMVVDFTKDNSPNGSSLSEMDVAEIRAKVKEGDLTPVLRAYEKDLRNPFVGTVKGDLVRALLIQIQKTKVDIEVAVSGIDALLKSQELVFGFVGLTPGVLVCWGVAHWLSGFLGGRHGRKMGRKHGQAIRSLRNIDRILSASGPSDNEMLSYKEHGLLLCEAHVLRQTAQQVLPAQVNAEFLEELSDLMEVRSGIHRQNRVVKRIRWAYAKWFHL